MSRHETPLVDHLFCHEAGRMVSPTRLLGFDQLAAAEDPVQDPFLAAFQTWKLKGMPDNPTAWLYQAARHKAFNYLKKRVARQS